MKICLWLNYISLERDLKGKIIISLNILVIVYSVTFITQKYSNHN